MCPQVRRGEEHPRRREPGPPCGDPQAGAHGAQAEVREARIPCPPHLPRPHAAHVAARDQAEGEDRAREGRGRLLQGGGDRRGLAGGPAQLPQGGLREGEGLPLHEELGRGRVRRRRQPRRGEDPPRRPLPSREERGRRGARRGLPRGPPGPLPEQPRVRSPRGAALAPAEDRRDHQGEARARRRGWRRRRQVRRGVGPSTNTPRKLLGTIETQTDGEKV